MMEGIYIGGAAVAFQSEARKGWSLLGSSRARCLNQFTKSNVKQAWSDKPPVIDSRR